MSWVFFVFFCQMGQLWGAQLSFSATRRKVVHVGSATLSEVRGGGKQTQIRSDTSQTAFRPCVTALHVKCDIWKLVIQYCRVLIPRVSHVTEIFFRLNWGLPSPDFFDLPFQTVECWRVQACGVWRFSIWWIPLLSGTVAKVVLFASPFWSSWFSRLFPCVYSTVLFVLGNLQHQGVYEVVRAKRWL